MRNDVPIKREAGFFPWDYERRTPHVRIHWQLMRHEGIRRNEWIAVCSAGEGCTIYRKAQGSGDVEGFDDETIMLAYDDMKDLEPDRSRQTVEKIGELSMRGRTADVYPVDWTLHRLRGFEKVMPYWCHPDDGYRLSFRISIVSLIVGLLGFVMGIAGLVA